MIALITYALIVFQIGVALSYVLWAFAGKFTLFVIARVIGGLAKGNVSLSTAVVADIYKPSERGRGMVSLYFFRIILTFSMDGFVF